MTTSSRKVVKLYWILFYYSWTKSLFRK